MVDYREIIRLKSTKPEMSNTMIAVIGIIILLILLVAGMNIGAAMMASSVGSSRITVSEVWKLVQE